MIKVFNSPETLISPEIISFSFLCQALQNILGIARRSCTYLGWSCRLSCSLHEKTRHHRLMVRGTSCTLATSAFWRQRSSTCNARAEGPLHCFIFEHISISWQQHVQAEEFDRSCTSILPAVSAVHCHLPGSQSSRLSCSRGGAFRSYIATWRNTLQTVQIYSDLPGLFQGLFWVCTPPKRNGVFVIDSCLKSYPTHQLRWFCQLPQLDLRQERSLRLQEPRGLRNTSGANHSEPQCVAWSKRTEKFQLKRLRSMKNPGKTWKDHPQHFRQNSGLFREVFDSDLFRAGKRIFKCARTSIWPEIEDG